VDVHPDVHLERARQGGIGVRGPRVDEEVAQDGRGRAAGGEVDTALGVDRDALLDQLGGQDVTRERDAEEIRREARPGRGYKVRAAVADEQAVEQVRGGVPAEQVEVEFVLIAP
jgi:hypothetical protein